MIEHQNSWRARNTYLVDHDIRRHVVVRGKLCQCQAVLLVCIFNLRFPRHDEGELAVTEEDVDLFAMSLVRLRERKLGKSRHAHGRNSR